MFYIVKMILIFEEVWILMFFFCIVYFLWGVIFVIFVGKRIWKLIGKVSIVVIWEGYGFLELEG